MLSLPLCHPSPSFASAAEHEPSLAAAVDLVRDAAHRHGASINEDIVRRELGAIVSSRAELVEYLTSANVHKLLSATCSNHVEKVWAEVGHPLVLARASTDDCPRVGSLALCSGGGGAILR